MYKTVHQLRPEWRRTEKPIGVEYGEPHYIPQVPSGLGTNGVQYQTQSPTQCQWTNVRGYGNILVYTSGEKPLTATYKVSQWNI
jgi:hypothetical protein